MYTYKATITDVYDGDTFTADIDLGLFIWARKQKLRLARVNCPEVRGEDRTAGLTARDFVRNLILGKEVTIQTYKDDKGKYGRWIADVYYADGDCQMVRLSDELVAAGLAEYVEY